MHTHFCISQVQSYAVNTNRDPQSVAKLQWSTRPYCLPPPQQIANQRPRSHGHPTRSDHDPAAAHLYQIKADGRKKARCVLGGHCLQLGRDSDRLRAHLLAHRQAHHAAH
eukprot:775773-Pleurochrysis_carterae.AAC.1